MNINNIDNADNPYPSIEDIETSRANNQIYSLAERILETSIDNNNFSMNIQDRVVFSAGNIKMDRFVIDDVELSQRQGTYMVEGIATYTQYVPMLPPDMNISLNDPLGDHDESLSIEKVKVMAHFSYANAMDNHVNVNTKIMVQKDIGE